MQGTMSDETKQKISKTMSEKNLSGENNWMYGKIPWNKGISWSEDTKSKISDSKKGKHRVYDDKEKNIYHYE